MIRPTTFLSSLRLNRHISRDILLACETFQHTGSFKFRAAWHLVSNIPNDHLLTASSGNFGQALAMACREMQKHCTVVMPNTSAAVKVAAVREFGGCVEFVDVQEEATRSSHRGVGPTESECLRRQWVITTNS